MRGGMSSRFTGRRATPVPGVGIHNRRGPEWPWRAVRRYGTVLVPAVRPVDALSRLAPRTHLFKPVPVLCRKTVRASVLGPIELTVEGMVHTPKTPKVRSVFALLVLNANETVST